MLSVMLFAVSALQIAEVSSVTYEVRFEGYIGVDLWKALVKRENGSEKEAAKTAERLVEKHVDLANQWAEALKPTSFQLKLLKPLILLRNNEGGVVYNRTETRCKVAANLGIFQKFGKVPYKVHLRHLFTAHGIARRNGCASGLAFSNTACSWRGYAYSAGHAKIQGLDSEKKLRASAYTFAHEVGHTLGIGHSCYRPETDWKNAQCSELLRKHMDKAYCPKVQTQKK